MKFKVIDVFEEAKQWQKLHDDLKAAKEDLKNAKINNHYLCVTIIVAFIVIGCMFFKINRQTGIDIIKNTIIHKTEWLLDKRNNALEQFYNWKAILKRGNPTEIRTHNNIIKKKRTDSNKEILEGIAYDANGHYSIVLK